MNKDIKVRTTQKIQENQGAKQHYWSLILNEQHQFRVLPGVFSPAIFLGTAWLTGQVLKHVTDNSAFLEIGTGCGVTSIEVALGFKACKVTAIDINPKAIQNTIINMKKFSCQFEVIRSDMFQMLQGRKYGLIYWNCPFHPSDKKTQQLSFIEKSIMDPGYQTLRTFLSTASEYLEKNGKVLLGFSTTMGNIALLQSISKDYNWKSKIVSKMVQGGTICLIEFVK